jgi:hypothetical protein
LAVVDVVVSCRRETAWNLAGIRWVYCLKFFLNPSIKEVCVKYIFTLLALVSIANTAVAASTGSDAAKPAAASPHGGMPTGKAGAALPPGHPAIPADTKLANSGKVLEVIDSPMYTYLQVTSDKGPLWLAAYKTDVTKGATVKYSGGIAMPKFHSKSLNRTFDMVVFVDSLEQVKK